MNVTAYTIEEMKALVRPCVYAFLRNGKVMYIGKSCNGILRPLSPKHHVRGGSLPACESLSIVEISVFLNVFTVYL
ncbi:MAG: hypothetical protein WA785_20095 [Candidatus Acidiferrales bacterium]